MRSKSIAGLFVAFPLSHFEHIDFRLVIIVELTIAQGLIDER